MLIICSQIKFVENDGKIFYTELLTKLLNYDIINNVRRERTPKSSEKNFKKSFKNPLTIT